MLDEFFMYNDTGFLEAVHSFDYFDVDIALKVNLIREVILINDFLRDVTQ